MSVYFVQSQAGGPIKIGYAAHPTKRLGDLKVGSPQPLVLLLEITGGRALESELHARFSAGRLHGEWFAADTAGLIDYIAQRRTEQADREERRTERLSLLEADDDYLLKAREVGLILRISTSTVLDWWEAGKLPGFRIHGPSSGPVRFRLGDIRDLVSTRRALA